MGVSFVAKACTTLTARGCASEIEDRLRDVQIINRTPLATATIATTAMGLRPLLMFDTCEGLAAALCFWNSCRTSRRDRTTSDHTPMGKPMTFPGVTNIARILAMIAAE